MRLRHCNWCMQYRNTGRRVQDPLSVLASVLACVLTTAFQMQACISGTRGKIRIALFRFPRKIACHSLWIKNYFERCFSHRKLIRSTFLSRTLSQYWHCDYLHVHVLLHLSVTYHTYTFVYVYFVQTKFLKF